MVAPKRRGAAKKGSITVDFTDTESNALIEEGDYLIEVDEVEQKESREEKNPFLSFTFKIVDGEFEGRKLYHNCSLQPQALFNLRGLLEALGFDVPQGTMELDPADLIGQQCMASVVHETYEGKRKARPVEFMAVGEEEEEEQQPAKPAAKPAAKKAAPAKEEAAPAGKKKVTKKKAIEVGSQVKFTDDEGNEVEGEIAALGDGTADVQVGDDIWEISLEELSLV